MRAPVNDPAQDVAALGVGAQKVVAARREEVGLLEVAENGAVGCHPRGE